MDAIEEREWEELIESIDKNEDGRSRINGFIDNIYKDFEERLKDIVKEKVDAIIDKTDFHAIFDEALDEYFESFMGALESEKNKKTDEEATLKDFVNI